MLKKTLASMKPATDYQQRISVLENHAQEYPKIESAWKKCINDLKNHTDLVKEYETFPFNPDCSACKAQPWKAAFDLSKEEIILLKIEKRRLKPLMDQYDNEFSGLDEIQTLLKTERDGLARRITMEEQIQFIEQGLKEQELRETVESLRQSCQYHKEEQEWSIRGQGVLLQLRVLLRESIEKASEWISWYQW